MLSFKPIQKEYHLYTFTPLKLAYKLLTTFSGGSHLYIHVQFDLDNS